MARRRLGGCWKCAYLIDLFRKCLCLRQNLHPPSSLLNGCSWAGILIPVRIAMLILYDSGSIHQVLKSILINISSVSLRAHSVQVQYTALQRAMLLAS